MSETQKYGQGHQQEAAQTNKQTTNIWFPCGTGGLAAAKLSKVWCNEGNTVPKLKLPCNLRALPCSVRSENGQRQQTRKIFAAHCDLTKAHVFACSPKLFQSFCFFALRILSLFFVPILLLPIPPGFAQLHSSFLRRPVSLLFCRSRFVLTPLSFSVQRAYVYSSSPVAFTSTFSGHFRPPFRCIRFLFFSFLFFPVCCPLFVLLVPLRPINIICRS